MGYINSNAKTEVNYATFNYFRYNYVNTTARVFTALADLHN